MKPILLSALVLALALAAKAGWDDLPATGKVIDRRGEPRPPKPLGPVTVGLTPTPQRTIQQHWPAPPWPNAPTVWSWTHGK